MSSEDDKPAESEAQYLSYSGFYTYDTCPLRYKFIYVDKVVYDKDPRESLFGSAIGKVFQWFYDREMWKNPDPEGSALAVVREACHFVFDKAKFSPRTDEDQALARKIYSDLFEYIPKGVQTIRKFKLLSHNTRTELMLHVTYKSNKHDFAIRMGGYADFVYGTREPWILDGKGGSKQNVDPRQLIWYATQHYLRFRIAPVRLGWIFWRSPDEPLVWLDYTDHDIRTCVQNTYRAASKIRLNMFDPTPSKRCNFCEFKDRCPEGRQFIEMMNLEAKPRIDPDTSLFIVHDV